MMIVYQGNNYQIRVGDLLSVAGVPTTRQVIAGTGLTGGGQLTDNVTLSVGSKAINGPLLEDTGVSAGVYGSSTSVPVLTVDSTGRVTAATSTPVTVSGYVPTTRQVIAGNGLVGGGPLNADITLSANLSNATPQVQNDAGSPGVATSVSRSDHAHPAIDLTQDSQVDGILGLDHGGTARSLVMNPGAVIWSGSDGLYVSSQGTPGQVLLSGGTAAPSWGTSVILSPQHANAIFAGPTTGVDADPTFRAMVNADLPNSGVSAASYGSGTAIPVITVNAKGVITSASSTPFTATTTNSLTFNNSGSGSASGVSFDGSAAYTISYNSIGASPLAGSTNLITLGTVTTGTWNATPIANSSLANSSITIGTTPFSLGSTSLTLGGLTSVTLTQDPTSALQAATKQYVDAAISNTNYHPACNYATTADLGSVTYNNGSSGVGATLTNAGVQTALVIDGHTFTATDVTNGVRVLVKNETSGQYNGAYVVTNQGSGSTNWVLTRATDYDQVGTGQGEVAPGDTIFVISGTVNASTQWTQTTDFPITLGTTPLAFAQIGGATSYTAGTGLSLVGTQFSIANTSVTASTYGSASSVPAITVNAQGQLTGVTNTSIAINGNQITSGTVGSAYISGSYTGITGVGTVTVGTWNATPIANTYLANSSITINGSAVSLGGTTTVTANTTNSLTFNNAGTGAASGTVFNGSAAYTISYNTVGASPLAGSTSITTLGTITTGTWSGSTISVGRGGTGLTTYTIGDLPYASGTSTISKLGIGTNGQVLTSSGSAPQWSAQSGLAVGTATNLAGGAASQIPYQSAAGTTSFISNGTAGQVLTSAGSGTPTWSGINGGTF
jgi:hypothetical protein